MKPYNRVNITKRLSSLHFLVKVEGRRRLRRQFAAIPPQPPKTEYDGGGVIWEHIGNTWDIQSRNFTSSATYWVYQPKKPTTHHFFLWPLHAKLRIYIIFNSLWVLYKFPRLDLKGPLRELRGSRKAKERLKNDQDGPGRQDIGFVGLNCIFICLGTIPGWKSAVL